MEKLWPKGYQDLAKVAESLDHFRIEDEPSDRFRNLLEINWRSGSPDDQKICLGSYTAFPQYTSRPYGSHFEGTFWHDSQFSFILGVEKTKIVDGEPESSRILATIGFEIISNNPETFYTPESQELNLEEGDIFIHQIQGMRGKLRFRTLSKFNWERVLVSITTFWAEDMGFPRICILPAERNQWFERASLKNPEGRDFKRALLRYNGTAKKCGFKKEDSLYVKHLT